MNDPTSTQTIFLSGPAALARILAQDQPNTALWDEEMRAIWAAINCRHESRRTSARCVLSSSSLRNEPEAAAFKDKSFSDLLTIRKPPLALLKLTKDFAKQTLKEAEDSQLQEIAAASTIPVMRRDSSLQPTAWSMRRT